MNDYTLGSYGIPSAEGGVDDKVASEEFHAGKIFNNAASIGSRDNIVFQYQGMDCALADAAAQKDGGKALQTIFVGKFLRTHNTVEVSEPITIYLKGNDRALKPDSLEEMHVLEETKAMAIYGSPADKKILTKKVKDAIRAIKTDSLLCDATIVISSGRTFFYLGYEDDIMVLPSQKPFNPKFVQRYKEQLKVVLDAALTLNQND